MDNGDQALAIRVPSRHDPALLINGVTDALFKNGFYLGSVSLDDVSNVLLFKNNFH